MSRASSRCAWCEEATGELVVPGARGAYVHPSCEAKRRGRRSFLAGAAVLAGAAAAAPLLDLVPEAPLRGTVTVTGIDYVNKVITLDAPWVFYLHPAQAAAWEKLADEMLSPRDRHRRRVVLDRRCPPDRAYVSGDGIEWRDA